MSQVIDLGRLRFFYRGNYDGSTAYEINDVVLYGGSAYVYIFATVTSGNPPTNTTYWGKLAEGVDFRGTWSASTQYFENDIVVYANILYIANIKHTSSAAFETDQSINRWQSIVEGFGFKGEWTPSTEYFINDIVAFGGNTFISSSRFVSDSDFSNDTEWTLFAQGAASGEVAAQTSNSGKLLSTDGTNTVWVEDVSVNSIESNTANIAEDVNVGSGAEAFSNTLLNPIAIFQIDADDFAQLSFRNLGTSVSSSTDIIAYSENGTDDGGWIDMGITNENFDDSSFTITKGHDGYIFLEVEENTTGNGDLVIATGGYGQRNAIVFAAGGLQSDNTQMKILPDQTVHVEISTASTSPTTGALTVVGGIGSQGDLNILGDLKVQGSIQVSGGTFQVETISYNAPILPTGTGAVDDVAERGYIVEYKTPTDPESFNIGTVSASNDVLTITRAAIGTINKTLINNVVSLELDGTPDFDSGTAITVSGLGEPFDGSYTVTSINGDVITYNKNFFNIDPIADTAGSVVADIDTTEFLNGDRITISGSDITDINGNRDFVISVSGSTLTTNFGSLVIANTSATGTVTVSSKTFYSGLVRSNSSSGNNWHLVSDVPPVLQGNINVPPIDAIDLTDTNIGRPTLVLGGLSFVGTPVLGGDIEFTGSPQFTGDQVSFSSNTLSLSNSTIVTGNPVFSGSPVFTGTPSFTGGIRVQEMKEDVALVSCSGEGLTLDYTDANIFYVTTDGFNFIPFISNFPTTDNRIVTINFIIPQGASAYRLDNIVSINGDTVTVNWATGTAPTPTPSKIDVFSLTIFKVNNTFTALGSANLGFG